MSRRTRFSQASAQDEDSPEPKNRKAENALKKLLINGKDTLIGAPRPAEDANVVVYHHRGGSYAVTQQTPQSWVDNQPARYLKRQSKDSMDPESEVDEQDGEEEAEPVRPSRKRTRMVEDVDEDERLPKRARRSANGTFDGVAVDDNEYDDNESPHRPRRNQPAVFYGRRPRQIGGSNRNTPRKRRRQRSPSEEYDDMPSSRRYDYAVVGGRDEMSCQEAVRRHHEMLGLEVAPIENKFDKNSEENRCARAVARNIAQLVLTNTEIARKCKELEQINARIDANRRARRAGYGECEVEAEKMDEDLESPPQVYRAATATEPLPWSHGEQKEDALRRRSASPRAYQRTRTFREFTPPLNDRNSVPPVDIKDSCSPDAAPGAARDEIDDEAMAEIPVDIQDNTQLNTPDESEKKLEDELPNESSTSVQDEPHGEAEDEDHDDNVVIITSRHDSIHSATSLTEDNLQQIPADSPTISLPKTNKNGDKLRWSLPSQIADRERAEAAILTSRMPHESKSARRRRVKRERKMVANWPEMTVTEGSVGGVDVDPAEDGD